MELKQRPAQSIESHGKGFLAQCDALEEVWGRLQPHNLVGSPTDLQLKAGSQFKAALFLASVDKERCGAVITSLHSDYLSGTDNHPKSVEATITLLKQRRDTKDRGVSRGAMFAQGDDVEEETDEEARSGAGDLTLEDLEQQVEDAVVSEPPGRRSHFCQDGDGNWVDRRTARRGRNSGGAFQA